MVDLVKVRKKAKEKKEKKEKVLSGVPVSSPAPEVAAAPKSAGEDTGAPLSAPPNTDKIVRFLETAGQRRTVRRVEETKVAAQLELLAFDMAGEHYAIDIESVVELITPRPITRIPNADSSIVGIFSLRGMIVTLIDARRRIGHGVADAPDENVRIIVVQHGGENVGFLVDRVLRVVKIDSDSVDPHPVVHASEQDDAVRGVFRHGETLTMLLNLETLLGGVAAWN
jgi:purine-binding chemotaxis protein CheW